MGAAMLAEWSTSRKPPLFHRPPPVNGIPAVVATQLGKTCAASGRRGDRAAWRTGRWQASGRSDLCSEGTIRSNVSRANNRSFGDAVTMLRTVQTVLQRRGAR